MGCSAIDLYAVNCVGLTTMQSTFECLKVSPFNLPSEDAREVEQKLHKEVPRFDPTYFKKLTFDEDLVSVFGLSKFQSVLVSRFAECTCGPRVRRFTDISIAISINRFKHVIIIACMFVAGNGWCQEIEDNMQDNSEQGKKA